MKRMLINATHEEEVRVAIVDGQKLVDLDIEHRTREQKKSNIYKARITRVEPSLEAAFVDYGAERHGFLPFKEIAREYLSEKASNGGRRPDVRAGIKEGQELIVQIEKEERSNKGAALTTFISLAGRFLVLMPNNPRAGGVSRRIEGEERNELREAMSNVNVPKGMGTIVRTAGVGRSAEELQWDVDYQCEIWKAISKASEDRQAPFLIYQESNIIVRALRDNFRNDVGEIVADEDSTHQQASDFIRLYMPQNERKLKLHTDDVPLFNRYQIESQIESAFQREVRLPSGGSLVIDHTEALISIDINSAKATKGTDIEETATNTNLEAADEVARQLRLRDLGGLVVIDFIDMMANKNQRAVETRLREALKVDRARVQIGRISRFGLLEMSRQRLRPSLGEASEIVCPRCSGHGKVRGTESTALSILRLLEEEAMKANTQRVLAEVPVEVATYLLNEKRSNISDIESRNEIELLIIANSSLDTPNYQIERVRTSETEHASDSRKSFELISQEEEKTSIDAERRPQVAEQTAAVTRVVPGAPAPAPNTATAESSSGNASAGNDNNQARQGGLRGLIGSFGSMFKGGRGEEPASETTGIEASESEKQTEDQNRSGSQSRNRKRNSHGGNQNHGKRGERNPRKDNNRDRKAGSNGQASRNNAKSKQDESSNRSGGRSQNQGNRQNNRGKQNHNDNAHEKNTKLDDIKAADNNTASDTDEANRKQDKRRRGPGRRRQSNSRGRNTTNAATNSNQDGDSAANENQGVAQNSATENTTVSTVQPSQLKSSVRSLAERQQEKARLEREQKGENTQPSVAAESKTAGQPDRADAKEDTRDTENKKSGDKKPNGRRQHSQRSAKANSGSSGEQSDNNKSKSAKGGYSMSSSDDFDSTASFSSGTDSSRQSSNNTSYAAKWSSFTSDDAGSAPTTSNKDQSASNKADNNSQQAQQSAPTQSASTQAASTQDKVESKADSWSSTGSTQAPASREAKSDSNLADSTLSTRVAVEGDTESRSKRTSSRSASSSADSDGAPRVSVRRSRADKPEATAEAVATAGTTTGATTRAAETATESRTAAAKPATADVSKQENNNTAEKTASSASAVASKTSTSGGWGSPAPAESEDKG